jgi:protocatechuate 3,4-dioxygenase beta subunit
LQFGSSGYSRQQIPTAVINVLPKTLTELIVGNKSHDAENPGMTRTWRILGVWAAMLAGCCLLLAGGAAAAPADVSPDNAATGETTDHEWSVAVGAGANGSMDSLTLNYTGSGADPSTAGTGEIEVNGTAYTVTSVGHGPESVELSLNSGVTVGGSERITLTLFGVANPDSAGSDDVTMELNDSTTAEPFHVETATLDVVQGGYINGTVGDAVAGDGIDGATVFVNNASTGEGVSTTTTDGTGAYSHNVPAGTYTAIYSKDGYASAIETVTVSTGAESTTNVGLYDEIYINGTVTDSGGSPVSGAELTVQSDSGTVFRTTTTDGSGNYSFVVANRTYTVSVSDSAYTAPDATGVSVDGGNETVEDFTVGSLGYINGTVTNESGAPVSGVDVATRADDGSDEAFTRTNASGHYSLAVSGGTYEVAIVDDDYEFDVTTGVGVTSGATTTLDLTATGLPEKGTLSGTVLKPDGTPVGSGVPVEAGDTSYRFFNRTTTAADGTFEMKVPAATYRVGAEPTTGAPARTEGVDVTAGSTTDVTVQLSGVSYIDGTVTDASGSPLTRAFVVADGEDGTYSSRVDKSGGYNITAPPGDYTVSVFAKGSNADSRSVTTTAGNSTTVDFETKRTKILHRSVDVTSGSVADADDLEVRAAVRAGLLQVQLVNESSYGDDPSEPSGTVPGKPDDLEPVGVDDGTEFEITVTVTNFTASSLLWGLDDADWETSDNATAGPNATDVTLRGSPVTLQANITANGVGPLLTEDPADVQWTTGQTDRATDGFNQTVYVGVFDLSTAPAEVRSNLDGISVTTNAQRFSTPRLVDGSLRVWVAAPSTTVEGQTHTGFYQATIPDAQLDEWGVDDPESELLTRYKGADVDATVTETTDGARIRIDGIGYSAGFVEVEPDTDDGGDSDSSDSSDDGNDGSTASDDPDPAPTATPTATATEADAAASASTATATEVEADADTPTATETDAATPASTPTPAGPRSTDSGPVDQPGFGATVAVAALAVLLAVVLLGRRE